MRRPLGKGLSQLIGEQFESNPTEVPISSIAPNSRQPRSIFADEPLQELAESIREFGVLQPLLVRPLEENTYELIAGERRLRASKLAGLTHVPVLIRAASGQGSLEIALIENVQREDINALEAARAYKRLIDEFQLTQEKVAERVGKSRAAVTNTLRLLRLPPTIQDGLNSGRLSEGHARALLMLESEIEQLDLFRQVLDKGLSVREVEKAAKKSSPKRMSPKLPEPVDPDLLALERKVSEHLGLPVHVSERQLVIDYYAPEDLERVLRCLGLEV